MDRKFSKILQIYRIILVLLFAVILSIFATRSLDIDSLDTKIQDISDNWVFTDQNGKIHSIDLANHPEVQLHQKNIILNKIVDQDMAKNRSIIFYTVYSNVKVFINGQLIYQHKGNLDSPYWDGGWKWNTILLPYHIESGDEISISLCRSYSRDFNHLPRVYSARISDFFDYILQKSFFSILIGGALFVLSLIIISVWLVQRGWKKGNWNLANIGLFAFFSAMSFSLRIPWVTWVFNDMVLLPTICFYTGLFAILPILNFSNQNSSSKYPGFYRYLFIASELYIIFRLIMEMSGYSAWFAENRYEGLIILCITGISFVVMVNDYRLTKSDTIRQYRIPLLFLYSIIFLDLMFVKTEIVYYSSNFIGALILLGVFYISNAVASNLAGSYADSIDAQKYQQLSETDILTGLKNRNSYTKKLESIFDMNGLAIIIMDVNNLKVVNDTYGHKEGDCMLVDVANKIREAFSDGYEVFRIGGDEFAVLSNLKTREEIEQDLWYFESEIRHMNEDKPYKFSVAAGLAIFEPFRRESIDELVNRADQNMYFKKIAIKL